MHPGATAQMKLAALCVQSVLLGVFVALVLAMFYLFTRRSTAGPSTGKIPKAERLLLSALVILLVMNTGHWICTVVRAFEAFVFWLDGQHPAAYYGWMTGTIRVAQAAFHSGTVVAADMMVITRLYVIWDYRRSVAVAPGVLSLVALLVSAIGTTYAYGAYNADSPSTLVSLQHWRIAHSVLTICTNVYSTGMIVWRVVRVNRRAAKFRSGTSLTSAILLIAESAAVYTHYDRARCPDHLWPTRHQQLFFL